MLDYEPPWLWPADGIEVGKIVDAWGVKGWFKVHPYAADPQALFSTKRWYIRRPSTSPAAPKSVGAGAGLEMLLKITQAKEHGDAVVALAQELADRSAAESLKGAAVYVSRSSFPTSADDEFYWVDLIGLTVLNRDAVQLGKVVGLLETGPHCVLRIAPELDSLAPGASADEFMIPFVATYVDSVDLPGRQIHVDWGLDF